MPPRRPERPVIRPAAPADAGAVARLMYASSAGIYDRYAGSPEAALRVLRGAFRRGGTTASAEVVLVAHLDGRVAGMAAAFPMHEASERAARFLWVTLSRVPPWRWVRTVRVFRQGAAAAAPPPPGSMYVDALATAEEARRQGVATALLAEVERRARERGLLALALETETDNRPARALYESLGFAEGDTRPPRKGLPAFVSLVKGLR